MTIPTRSFAVYSRSDAHDTYLDRRQVDLAESVAAAHDATLDYEFLDRCVPITVPWVDRPAVRRLIRFLGEPRFDLDGLVVPSPIDAFGPGDLSTALALLNARGVDLIVGETSLHRRSRQARNLERVIREVNGPSR